MNVGICSRIVKSFSTWWTFIGWIFFVSSILLVFPPGGFPYAVSAFFLMLVWWTIDVISQSVPIWQILVGIVMIAMIFLPRGFVLLVTAWMIYWFKIRE